jgi:hypothetical protein
LRLLCLGPHARAPLEFGREVNLLVLNPLQYQIQGARLGLDPDLLWVKGLADETDVLGGNAFLIFYITTRPFAYVSG